VPGACHDAGVLACPSELMSGALGEAIACRMATADSLPVISPPKACTNAAVLGMPMLCTISRVSVGPRSCSGNAAKEHDTWRVTVRMAGTASGSGSGWRGYGQAASRGLGRTATSLAVTGAPMACTTSAVSGCPISATSMAVVAAPKPCSAAVSVRKGQPGGAPAMSIGCPHQLQMAVHADALHQQSSARHSSTWAHSHNVGCQVGAKLVHQLTREGRPKPLHLAARHGVI